MSALLEHHATVVRAGEAVCGQTGARVRAVQTTSRHAPLYPRSTFRFDFMSLAAPSLAAPAGVAVSQCVFCSRPCRSCPTSHALGPARYDGARESVQRTISAWMRIQAESAWGKEHGMCRDALRGLEAAGCSVTILIDRWRSQAVAQLRGGRASGGAPLEPALVWRVEQA